MYKPTGFIALPMLGLLVVVAAAIAFGSWWIAGREEAVTPTISNFAECAAAGNAIMESYPRQCAANGQTFVEVIANANATSLEKCEKWERGICEAMLPAGYHYDAATQTCEYFSGGSGCSNPPFTTKDACQQACANQVVTNTNTAVNRNTNTAVDPTAGWKMVMNSNGKYTLRYPVGWQATVSATIQGRTSIKPSNYDEKAQIELAPDFVATVVASIEPAALAGATSKEIADLDCNQNRKTIIVNGIQSIQQDQSCFATWVSTYIPRSDGKYILISWPEVFEDEYPEFEQILSTFTFLDETIGWKTYTNEVYRYSFQYPSSWGLQEFTYNPNEPLSDDYVVAENPVDTIEKFRVCPNDHANDCIPFQDGEWRKESESITIGSRAATVITYTYDESIACPSCTIRQTITFDTRPNGWKGGYDILLVSGKKNSLITTKQILSTFTFTK